MRHKMTNYRITNAFSELDLGVYSGENEDEALLAMAKDAGYSSIEEMDKASTPTDGEFIFEEVRDVRRS